jgi:curved DNA-binding protein CbpA
MARGVRADRDYYRLLEVRPDAGEEEIRRAYRRLALRWHPDRNPGRPEAGERFKEISEAYAVLVDATRRRDYDRARQSGRPADFQASREDLFRDLFTDPRASAVFEELVQEFERLGVRVHRQHFQDVLIGGRRVVVGGAVVIGPLGPFAMAGRVLNLLLRGMASAPAPAAPARPRPGLLSRLWRWLGGGDDHAIGDGVDALMPLTLTRGEAMRGVRRRLTVTTDGRTEEVLVKVPAGVGAGARLRLRGKGHRAPGGGRGDLYLAIDIVDAW